MLGETNPETMIQELQLPVDVVKRIFGQQDKLQGFVKEYTRKLEQAAYEQEM
jgi:hypothetical protein